MPLGMEVGLGPGDFVLDGDPALPPKKRRGTAALFDHVYCGQTAGRIKMSLGTKVRLGPGHILLDRDPAPPKGAQPQFPLMSFVAERSPISATVEHLLRYFSARAYPAPVD